MPDTTDLIRRARELARLAEKATPGPWAIIELSRLLVHRGDIEYCDDPECSCLDDGIIASTEKEEDAVLVRAAPEMAHLLGQLADELDWIIKWALERCYCECGRGFLERGMHGPDCLIEELGLDDLVEHEEFQRKRDGVRT